jgi:hypothetical protein
VPYEINDQALAIIIVALLQTGEVMRAGNSDVVAELRIVPAGEALLRKVSVVM